MKTSIFLIGVLVCVGMACKESTVAPPTDANLIPNGSFETDHTPTIQGWRFGNPQLAQLVNEAPPDGGNWSLQLTADWAPTSGFVYTPVTNVHSGDIVKLSAYIRATGRFGGGGVIRIVTGPNNYSSHAKWTSSTDTLWSQVSIIDTLTLSPGDTVWVVLSSFITEIIPRQGLFDLVKLEQVSK